MMSKGTGEDFASKYLETKGWSQGDGLGRHGQGIVDAIKPKLKFDNTGVGHNQAEEFEFRWWDHVFNKAAQSIQVGQNDQGDVQVNFTNDKDLSTKKTNRKKKEGEKKKNALYSCFIKSGTLIGGTLEGEEEKDQMVTEDMSKALTDDELVKACGGLTAHKGARHGHKMDAKLQRVKEAERRYMEEFEENQRKKEESSKIKKKKRKRERSVDSTNEVKDEIEDIESQKCKDNNVQVEEIEIDSKKSKKKKKKSKKSSKESDSPPCDESKKQDSVVENEIENKPEELVAGTKKKKSKKDRGSEVSNVEVYEQQNETPKHKKKKHKKKT